MSQDGEVDKAARSLRPDDESFRDRSEHRRSEDALGDGVCTLEILNATVAALATTRDRSTLLRMLTEAATRLSGAQCGAFVASPETGADGPLVVETAVGDSPALAGALQQRFARRLFETMWRTFVPVRSDAVADETTSEGTSGPGVASYLAVPVVAPARKPIGGVFLLHAGPGVFDEPVQRLVSSLATQAAIAIENVTLYAALERDATERARLLDAERAARAHAERMSEIKDDFLATLSHELRTPLNAILGWAQVLHAGPRRAADLDKGLEAIERNARMQTQLIEDLLDMSRITSGKLRLQVRPLMPLGFVEAALETVHPAAEAKSVRIDRLLDPGAGPVYGDPGRLQQVVWNLLSNAIKFTPHGGKVRVLLESDHTHVAITVSDTGIGIRPAFLPLVFDRFRQADASTTRSYQGLGLGLSIAKHLIELHGGRVSVHSRGEGLGARFVVQLPLVLRSESARSPALGPALAGKSEPAHDSHTFDLRGVKVVIVDDAADACDLMARTLGSYGARVMTADSAHVALALVESERPDVVLSDIGMPEMDGFALLEAVRALGPARGGAVPVIAITAYAHNEDRSRTAAAGFRLHMAKPVEPAALAAAVAEVLGRSAGPGRSPM